MKLLSGPLGIAGLVKPVFPLGLEDETMNRAPAVVVADLVENNGTFLIPEDRLQLRFCECTCAHSSSPMVRVGPAPTIGEPRIALADTCLP